MVRMLGPRKNHFREMTGQGKELDQEWGGTCQILKIIFGLKGNISNTAKCSGMHCHCISVHRDTLQGCSGSVVKVSCLSTGSPDPGAARLLLLGVSSHRLLRYSQYGNLKSCKCK